MSLTRAFITCITVLAFALTGQADTFTWSGASNDSWQDDANWDSPPTFDNTADIVFSTVGAANLTTYLGANTTIRSLGLNDNTGSTAGSVRTQVSSGDSTEVTLTLEADSGNATITRSSGSTGNNYSIFPRDSGDVVLGSDLDIDNQGASFFFAADIVETGGSKKITKTGPGTLTIAGINTFSGGFHILDGVVLVNGAGDSLGTGPCTLGTTGGVGNAALQWGTVGAILGDVVVEPQAPGTVSIIKGAAGLTQRNLQGLLTLNGDVTFDIRGTGLARCNAGVSGSGGVIVIDGQVNYATLNTTYTGDTLIGDGSNPTRIRVQSGSLDGGGDIVVTDPGIFEFIAGAQVTIYIGANGVNNSISGTGNLEAEGKMFLDLSGADTSPGNNWTIVSTSSNLYEATFEVDSTLGLFTEAADVHTLVDGANTWTYSEATGILSLSGPVISTPATLTNMVVSTGDVSFDVLGSGDYVVQVNTNLLQTNDWVDVFTNTADFTYTDTNTADAERFYRAVQ